MLVRYVAVAIYAIGVDEVSRGSTEHSPGFAMPLPITSPIGGLGCSAGPST